MEAEGRRPIGLLEQEHPGLLIEQLAREKRTVDLSIALLKFQLLPMSPIEVSLDAEEQKQIVLIAPRGRALILPNGRRIFDPNALVDIEDHVRRGFRQIKHLQNDMAWATLVGLSGVFGLAFESFLSSLFSRRKDKAQVRRWIDERGNAVYVAKDSNGMMAHLMAVGFDRRYYMLYEPLVNALLKTRHYVLRFTYPATATSWQQALGLEVDPQIEVLLDPVA